MITPQEISDTIKSKGRYWIAFTGDSITSCEWVHPNWREVVEYVLKCELEKMFGINDWHIPSWGLRAFNFAYDGATTKDILQKTKDINLIKADLIICIMGSNDIKFGINPQEQTGNIRKIVEILGTKVVWCTSTPAVTGSEVVEYEPYAKATMLISQNQNLQLIDMFNIYRQFPLEEFFTFKSEYNPIEEIEEGEMDPTHPNQLGNAYIAKVILKEVFGIDFNPEKYWKETLAGEKYPKY